MRRVAACYKGTSMKYEEKTVAFIDILGFEICNWKVQILLMN